MTEEEILHRIAQELKLRPEQVRNTARLLDEGNTVPFITRYRKEMTGELDEETIRTIEERLLYSRVLEDRKATVRSTIEEQDQLTPELEERIRTATKLQEVEDLYLPYKPKRRTRGIIAREKGLEPLSEQIIAQEITEGTLEEAAASYLDPEQDLHTIEDVLQGARDVVAEIIAEDADVRGAIRERTLSKGLVVSEARNPEAVGEYQMYYEYQEPVRTIPPHRILAINRGEREAALRVRVQVDAEAMIAEIEGRRLKTGPSLFAEQMKTAIRDAYRRLIAPSIEREVRSSLTEKAEAHAIQVFSENLRRLLLLPPVRGKRILGIDPGYRTGCKVAVIDETGKYLEGGTIYPHKPQARMEEAKTALKQMIEAHAVDLVAIGNGTACRETEQLVADLIPTLARAVVYIIVDEAGASVYSASRIAQKEFPDLEASLRGNISIARRLLDPLAELVKIDPRSLGVGLYQHDVSPTKLRDALEIVIESCVNYVGVELNTASASLLRYVSGVTVRTAEHIVRHRDEHGPFENREQLKDVYGVGDVAFQQAAGFLRIPDGEHPLDNTSIHPESYAATQALLNRLRIPLSSIRQPERGSVLRLLLRDTDRSELASDIGVGLPTLKDILDNLEKPGRDPREELPKPIFRTDVLKIEDLKEGMVLKGTVRNVVDFGAFVDIGIKNDGLVHISQMANRFVKSPFEVVSVGDVVDVKVVSIDVARGRVGLSMRG